MGTQSDPRMIVGYTLEGRLPGSAVQIAKVRVDGVYYLLKFTPVSDRELSFDYEVTNGEPPEWWKSPA